MQIAQYLKKKNYTQAHFARLLGVSTTILNQWLSGKKPVSPQKARLIEKETGGEVTRLELRPDIFA